MTRMHRALVILAISALALAVDAAEDSTGLVSDSSSQRNLLQFWPGGGGGSLSASQAQAQAQAQSLGLGGPGGSGSLSQAQAQAQAQSLSTGGGYGGGWNRPWGGWGGAGGHRPWGRKLRAAQNAQQYNDPYYPMPPGAAVASATATSIPDPYTGIAGPAIAQASAVSYGHKLRRLLGNQKANCGGGGFGCGGGFGGYGSPCGGVWGSMWGGGPCGGFGGGFGSSTAAARADASSFGDGPFGGSASSAQATATSFSNGGKK